MYNDVLNEAGVSIECRNCKRRTTVPAAKVHPGVKCCYCDADLVIDELAIAYKEMFLAFALDRTDTKID